MYPRFFLRSFARAARRRWLVAGLGAFALAGATLPAITGAAPGVTAAHARADVTTISQNTLRDDWDSSESPSLMGPSAVPHFVQRWRVPLSGQIYAQPLVIGNTVFVVTENDWVYGLDRTTGAQLWSNHLGNAFVIGKAAKTSLRTCADLVPNVGITGTPVQDTNSSDSTYGDVFFFANVMSGTTPYYYLYGLDPSTGQTKVKIKISGHPSNASKLTFSAQMEQERPGALYMNGAVYGTFAAHCDRTPYSGYVARVNLSSHAVSLWSAESGVTYNRAGIWQSGGGVMSDGSGRLFVASGNGVSPAKRAGSSPGGQLAESVIRLGVNSSGTLSARDFFSPSNAAKLDAADTDYGSGGPTGLPYGTATYPHVLAQSGKDGRIFLLNRDNLGGHDQGSGGGDNVLSVKQGLGGQWGHPGIFEDGNTITNATNGTANNYLFFVGSPNPSSNPLQVFRITASTSDKPVLSAVAHTSLTYGYKSGAPAVTSNGNDPSSAVVWEVHENDKTGTGGELDAYALGPVLNGGSPSTCTSSKQCTLTPIWHSTSGFTATKFSVPATNAGWVYIGTLGTNTKGELIAYSLPSTSAPVNAAATRSFAPTTVGGTSTAPVTVTATKAVTLTGASTAAGATNTVATNTFTAPKTVTVTTHRGKRTTGFPVTLAKGDKVTASVTFSPAAPGSNEGSLSFATSGTGSVNVPLSGEGTKAGLQAEPASVPFPLAPDQGQADVPVGIQVPRTLTFTNFSSSTETVSSVTGPAAPFSATGLPAVGTQLKPGATFAVQLSYAPTQPGAANSAITIATSNGSVTVPLSGVGTAAVSQLTAASPVVNFGTIPVGKQATAYVNVTNSGNTATTVKGTSSLNGPFAAPIKPDPGLDFNSSYNLSIPVKFTPHKTGTFTTKYTLTWSDVHGTHTLTVTLTGKAV